MSILKRKMMVLSPIMEEKQYVRLINYEINEYNYLDTVKQIEKDLYKIGCKNQKVKDALYFLKIFDNLFDSTFKRKNQKAVYKLIIKKAKLGIKNLENILGECFDYSEKSINTSTTEENIIILINFFEKLIAHFNKNV